LSRLQKKFLEVASRCKEPSPATLQKLLQGTSDAIGEIQNFREKNRTSPFFNHLSAWSEGIPALGWVTVVSIQKKH
jgi:adenylyl cyclase-associated protein